MDDATPMPPKKRARREPAPTTPDPIEIAMEAEASGEAPAREAAEVLKKHGVLIGWQIASERAGFALKLLTGLAALAAAAVLGGMVYAASQAKGVVIDGIAAPPKLAEAGFTPTALATSLQDRIAQMESETASVQAAASIRNEPLSNVKVQIPSTGISVDDLNQLLRQWLGDETHVSGEIGYLPGGPQAGALQMTVRVGGQAGRRFVQADGDLEPLLGHAAEHVHRSLDPIRHAAWLSQHGRADEGSALLRRLARAGSPRVRSLAIAGLADLKQTPHERLATYLQADRLSTDAGAASNASVEEVRLGYWERAYRRAQDVHRQPPPRGGSAYGDAQWPLLSAGYIGELTGDYGPMLGVGCLQYEATSCTPAGLAAAMETANGAQTPDGNQLVRISGFVRGAIGLHELSAAARIAAAPMPDVSGRSASFQANVQGTRIRVASLLAVERRDWPEVLRQADAWDALAAYWPGLRAGNAPTLPRAEALAELGDAVGAERAAAALPLDCYPCVVARGRVAARLGKPAEAEHWFAEAARMAPSLPFAEFEWGRALARQGRADAAIGKFKAAVRKGPRFADPLEAWGEVLLARGDAKGAAAKFAAADKLAPNWGRLHLKWGQALARLGKTDAARAQWVEAGRLYLTQAERAELPPAMQGAR